MLRVYKKCSVMLCLFSLISFIFLGCAGHVHVYSNGLCACGKSDPNRETIGLEYVELPDGTMEVSSYRGIDERVYIPENKGGKVVTSIGENAFEGISLIKTVVLPNTITHIKDYAFNACSGIRNITIPENVKYIGAYAYADCNDVLKVTYNAINCDDVEMGGNLFRRLGSTIKDVELIVGKKVQRIPSDLFYGTNYQNYPFITSVTFEDDSECKEIGDHAFMHCRSLKTFDLGKNTSLERIGDSCFGNCMALEEFTLPKTMKVIEKYAFSATTALWKLTIEDPNGWCVRKFDLSTWDVLYYKEITTEQMNETIETFSYYNGLYFSKIADPVPNWNGLHEHDLVNGVCRCWFVSNDHVHKYENGVCACKDVTSAHVHVFDDEGICACKAVNEKHEHSFFREMCNCGVYSMDFASGISDN